MSFDCVKKALIGQRGRALIDNAIEAKNFRLFENRSSESFLAMITARGGGVLLTCS